jgi:hypothetical protein
VEVSQRHIMRDAGRQQETARNHNAPVASEFYRNLRQGTEQEQSHRVASRATFIQIQNSPIPRRIGQVESCPSVVVVVVVAAPINADSIQQQPIRWLLRILLEDAD